MTAEYGMTGTIKRQAQKIILPNAFTFSSSEASQSVTLSDYKDCDVIGIYTNSDTLNLMTNSYVSSWNFDKTTGVFTITRTTSGAWGNTPVKLVLMR